MEKAKSFLFLENKNCLFCSKSLGNSGFVNFTDKGWESVKSDAVKWKRIKVPIDDLCYLFTTVEEKVKDADKAYGGAHKTCRINFFTKSAVYAKRFGLITDDEKSYVADDEKKPLSNNSNVTSSVNTRTSVATVTKNCCFICNIEKSDDDKPYNDGGVGQPKDSVTGNKLKERTKVYLASASHVFHSAACRFVIQIGGLDAIVVNIHYHQSCYIR